MNESVENADVAYVAECGEFANELAERISKGTRTPPVSAAVEPILRRVMNSTRTIAILRMGQEHDVGFDIAVILRAMYDAMLQGLYILSDPNKREERASLFLDYTAVEQFNGISRFCRSSTWVGSKMAGSPLRPEREPLITNAYESVKGKYLDKNGRIRRYWYEGSLRDIARDVGFESEYDLLQSHLSSMVHSTPFALLRSARVDDHAITWAWIFARRLAFRYAEWCQVPLTDDDRAMMASDFKNIFGSSAEVIEGS